MNSSLHVILKNSNLLFLSLLMAIPGIAFGQNHFFKETLGGTGSIRPSYWSRDKNYSDDRDYLVGSAWITLRPVEILGFKTYLDAYVLGQNLSRDDYSEGELREAYVEKSWGNFDLKVGRQIIIWGRADKVNPTDNLTVKNYGLLMTDDEDQRLGIFSTQMVYNLESLRLIAVWLPEWRSPIFPIKANPAVTFKNQRPDESQNQFGLKIDSSGGEIDWSLSYFDGFSKTPNLKVLTVGPVINLAFDYGAIKVYGADFAKNIGQYGMRGEVAYTDTKDSNGKDPLKQNSFLFAALGVDRTIIENFNINVQVLYRHVEDFADTDSITNPSSQVLGEQLALVANQQYEDQVGISFRPSYKILNETLEMEIAYVSWLRKGDSLVRPKVTYSFTDQVKGTVGGEFYNGSVNSFFGRLKSTSAGFAELRYLF